MCSSVKTSRMRRSPNAARREDLTAICDRTKKKKEAGISTRAFPLETRVKSYFVWYVITCHLTTYRASRNRFPAISFHDDLRYCGIFLAHVLMKIDRNIISSLYIVFSLCARVGWCDVVFLEWNHLLE